MVVTFKHDEEYNYSFVYNNISMTKISSLLVSVTMTMVSQNKIIIIVLCLCISDLIFLFFTSSVV